MRHIILVTENGKGAPSAEIFDKIGPAKEAFRKIKSGVATLYDVARSQAVKRANFNVEHTESDKSLSKMTDVQLRAEAKKRNLAIAGNPQAKPSEIINEIQQDELTRRLHHRTPLTESPGGGSSSSRPPTKPAAKPASK